MAGWAVVAVSWDGARSAPYWGGGGVRVRA